MGLRLYAVTMLEGHGAKMGDGVDLVPFRDVAAAVTEAPYAAEEPGGSEVELYQRVITELALQRPVLPAPVGTVFRSHDTLTRWLELHYVALSDALAFVEDRDEARVHVSRASGELADREVGADLAAAAAESFRAMRRGAVASVPLRTEHLTGIVLSSGFLVDKELWKAFVDTVQQERENRPDLRIELTGPWPPFDFVRMQFGG